MTSLLVWNIKNFSLPKIDPGDRDARDRLLYIIDQVMAVNPPDIFAVIEVFSRTDSVGYEGQLPSPGSSVEQGVNTLYEEIGNTFLGGQYSLVPPITNGSFRRRESVAVFYDNTRLQFIGPYVWGTDTRIAMGAPRACPVAYCAAPGPQPYPAPWAGYLPAGRNVPPNAWGGYVYANPGVPENRCAAQWEFYNAANQRIYFPDQDLLGTADSSLSRSPYLLMFLDPAGAAPPATGRVIKLFLMHAPPDRRSAEIAVGRLVNIPNLLPNANEVSVIAGDFNVDTGSNLAAYNPLLADFTMLLDPRSGGVVSTQRNPYCKTHLKDPGSPYAVNPYPQFDYMDDAIDNILVAYGPGVAPPAGIPNNPYAITVANTVLGTPYNQVPPPPDVTPELTNGVQYSSTLPAATQVPAAGLPLPPALLTMPQYHIASQFNLWPGRGRILSTSDHLAVFAEV